MKTAVLHSLFILLFLCVPVMATTSLVNVYDLQNPSWASIASLGTGFVVAGYSYSFLTSSVTPWILTLDSEGNVISKTDYSNGTGSDLSIQSTIHLLDGGVVVIGHDQISPAIILRFNSSGTLVWQKQFTGANYSILSGAEHSDGSLTFIGGAGGGEPVENFWIIRLTSAGGLLWQKIIRSIAPYPDFYIRVGYASTVTSDNGIIVGGFETQLFASGRAWVAKFSNAGNLQWEKKIDIPSIPSFFPASVNYIKQTSDEGYMLGIGSTGQPPQGASTLVKLNSSGSVQWSKMFDDPNMFQGSRLNLFFLQNGEIMGLSHPLVLTKINASGTVQWDKSYDPFPGVSYVPLDVTQAADGGFIVVAAFSCDSFETSQLMVMKVTSTGDLCTGNSPHTTPQNIPTASTSSFDTVTEGTSPMTISGGSFFTTPVTSAASVICTAESFFESRQDLLSTTCGASLFFEIIDQPCGANQACIDERKVLISKKGTTDVYPSQYQNEVPSPKDRKIVIRGQVSNLFGSPISNKPVYLSVIDPADPSPYVTPSLPGDNIDKDSSSPGGVGGKLDETEVPTDSNGQFQTILTVTTSKKCTNQGGIDCDPSGDNYQIEGGFTSVACGPNCTTKSGVITAWKRVYIERDKMFRMGGLLAENAVQGQSSILINGSTASLCPGTPTPPPSACCDSNPSGNACYQIALFDAVNTFEAPGSERPWVDYIVQSGSNWRLYLATAQDGNMPYQIQKSTYLYSSYPTFQLGSLSQIHGKSAGIGIISSNFYELSNNINLIETAFKDGFVETKMTSGLAGAMPFLPISFFDTSTGVKRSQMARFAKLWFSNCGGGLDWQCTVNNHFQLLGVDRDAQKDWGWTISDGNGSFISSGFIETKCAPNTPTENCKQFTATHEIGHQFLVNVCSGLGPVEHCLEPAWCSNPPTAECSNLPNVKCTMHNSSTVPDRSDGIERFEIKDLLSGYCPYQPDSIRKATDPK